MKEKNPFLEAALFYAQRLHWPVFPIRPRSKQPPLVKRGSLDASTDEQTIRAWWKRWPQANVAVRTGDENFVVDVDVRHGGRETFDSLEQQHGKLRDTLRQVTGRQDGSFQLIYQQPAGQPIANAENVCGWAGIDLRGTHGYILVPPSIHPDSGKEYFWDSGKKTILEEPINPADDWLVDAIRAAQNGHRTNGEHFTIPKGKIPHGQQKHKLFRLGSAMRQAGGEYPEIVEAMLAFLHNRCTLVEKSAEDNTIREAKWICEHYPAGQRIDIPPGPAHEPWPTLEPPPAPIRKHSLMSYTADCVEPQPIIDPILYPGLTILGGRPKAGKSWLALQLAIAVANQFKLGGYLTVQKKSKCLYVSLEDREPQLKKRLRHLVPDPSYLEGLDLMYELAPLLAGGAAQLDQTLTEDPVTVLVLDSLLAAVQAAGRKNVDIMQADYNIIRTLRELATKHAIALVLIAHTRKAGGPSLDLIQGTSGTTAAADAVWVLQRTPEGKATLTVTGREVPESVFGLERATQSPAWIITGEGDEVTQSDARQDIIQLLRDKCGYSGKKDKDGKYIKPAGGLKPSQIAKELRRPISTVNRLLAALCELGLVVKTGYGSYNLPGEDEPPEAFE